MPQAIINDRSYPLVPNTHTNLDRGMVTEIFQSAMTREGSEGVALIREVLRDDGDGFISARVEFADEPGESYDRRIWTGKTVIANE